MSKEFIRLGLEFTRVDATDARHWSESQIADLRSLYNSDQSLSYIAVLLSHLKVWEMIADGDEEVAAVYEDDVHFSPAFKRVIQAEQLFPRNVDIIRLETTLQSMKLARRPAVTSMDRSLFSIHDGAWGAAAYVIRKDTAKWLAATPARYRHTPDWMLFHRSFAVARALTVLQMDPAPCVQDQYHPIANSRIGFTMETSINDQPNLYRLGRRWLRPIVRFVRGRRAVQFG